ncbi:MAG: dienelactone hydrolase family protein [Chloroflexi bacterium]|nr:dienelactone hydrolase family protein [Chloroflexota bacterium]
MDTTDRFLGGSLSRRTFLSRLALVAGGSAVALACGSEATASPSPTAESTTAPARTGGDSAKPDSIEAGPIEFDADGEKLLGYLSRPTLPGPHPAIVVVHENRGLLPHFLDLTRRLAREGYVALAIDMLSRQGGADSFADANEMRTALGRIPRDQVVYDGNAAVAFLQDQSYVRRDRVGAMGFCFGGSIVWLMAVGNPELKAAVPFYGSAPPLEDVANLQVPVLGIYAGEDSRINAGVPSLEAELLAQQKDFKFVTYPGAGHAFFNDTGSRYHPQAAEGAWMETLDWFEDHLMDA